MFKKHCTITLSANTSWYLFNFRASTIRALVSAGHRVVCLSPADNYSPQLRSLGCEWQALPMDNAGTHPGRDLMLFCRLFLHYFHFRPAVAFHFTIKNNVYGTWAARALGAAAINNVSGLGTAFIRPGPVAAVVRTLYRLSQPLANRVFCQNAEDFDLLHQLQLVPADRLHLLPGSGVNLQRFNPALRVKRAAGEPLRLLYAGRMLADKGLYELMEAVGRINADGVRCGLILCGFAGAENVSAIDVQQLEKWALQPGIRWLGPSDDMPNVYAQADAVVLASYREGMPRSLLEACAMGLPAVATDVPGCRHIVTHGVNGLLCHARSADSLQKTLEQLLAMTDAQREALGAAGRARVVEEFDESFVVRAALDVVCEVLSQKKGRSNN